MRGTSGMRGMRGSEARTHLSSHPTSAAAARRFVGDVLRSWQLEVGDADAVLVCTDELVTNAIVHVASDIDVVVRCDDGVVRVEVHDGGRRPPMRTVSEVDADAGRGLLLVEAMSQRWGVASTEQGKAVWFEVGAA
jgi:anti-sigma regulatory factor (Ser/Thr protein kinase)